MVRTIQLAAGKYLQLRRGDGCPIVSLEVFRAPHRPPAYGEFERVHLCPEIKVEVCVRFFLLARVDPFMC